jgi:hypothetical protein
MKRPVQTRLPLYAFVFFALAMYALPA